MDLFQRFATTYLNERQKDDTNTLWERVIDPTFAYLIDEKGTKKEVHELDEELTSKMQAYTTRPLCVIKSKTEIYIHTYRLIYKTSCGMYGGIFCDKGNGEILLAKGDYDVNFTLFVDSDFIHPNLDLFETLKDLLLERSAYRLHVVTGNLQLTRR